MTWPVGIAGDFRGVIDRRTGDYVRYLRTSGGATAAPEERLTASAAAEQEGAAWASAIEEDALLDEIGADLDLPSYLAGESTPVLFGAALSNFGVHVLLDTLVDLAPSPRPRYDTDGAPRPVEAPFSGLVFKVQANMDPSHRDRIAFMRVCSGRFERGMVATHAKTGKPFTTRYAHAAFGQDRHTVDVAYPGDVIGLVNASALQVGDTLYAEQPVRFPTIASFAPEHFAVVRAKDSGRFKQFRRGMSQLAEEGVIQVLRSDRRGDQAPVLAAVGQMQFDVVTYRLEHEFQSPVTLEHLDYTLARRTDAASAATLDAVPGIEVMRRDGDEELLALVTTTWRLTTAQREHPELTLEPLVADDRQ